MKDTKAPQPGCLVHRFGERVTLLAVRRSDFGSRVYHYSGWAMGCSYEEESFDGITHDAACPCRALSETKGDA